jgi:hypothetical protein
MPIFFILILMWCLSPLELALQRRTSIQREVSVDIFRNIISIMSKFIIINYQNEASIILSFSIIYVLNFIVFNCFEKNLIRIICGINFLDFDFIIKNCLAGLISSVAIILLLKIDYILSIFYTNNFSKLLPIFLKFEEICLLLMTVYVPWFNRSIASNKFKFSRVFLYFLLSNILLITGFFISRYFIYYNSFDYFIKESVMILLSNFWISIFYIFTASLSCALFIMYNFIILSVPINKLLYLFISVLCTYVIILLLLLINNVEYFYLTRIIMLVSLILGYLYLYKINKLICYNKGFS